MSKWRASPLCASSCELSGVKLLHKASHSRAPRTWTPCPPPWCGSWRVRSSWGCPSRAPGSRCPGVSAASDAALEVVPGLACDGVGDVGHHDPHGFGLPHQVDWEVQGSGGEVCNRGRPYAKLTPGRLQGGGGGERRSVGEGSLTQNLTPGLRLGLVRRRGRAKDRGAVLAWLGAAGWMQRLSGQPAEPQPPLGRTWEPQDWRLAPGRAPPWGGRRRRRREGRKGHTNSRSSPSTPSLTQGAS